MLEVDKTNFEAEVLQADGYVLVDFFGDGCVSLPGSDASCTRHG